MTDIKRKRKDPKGRNLRTGETYDEKTGRYRYSYQDPTGRRRQLYSWTLTRTDDVPAGKKQSPGESLREKEEKARNDAARGIDSQAGNMTVYQLLERYVTLKSPTVRGSTRNGYKTQMKFMKENALAQTMARKRIKEVNAMEAESWMLELHQKEGRSYSSLHTLKGMLHQAFIRAKASRWVIDNPFDFRMGKKAYGGSKNRDSLSKRDMTRFLEFVRTDDHFNRYYDGIYILFNTGLRISEFCGLTKDDIDFEEHVIRVRRQLFRSTDKGNSRYYIEKPKTQNSIRDVPMTPDVEIAFQNVIRNRPAVEEMVVWDELHLESKTGFLWIDRDGRYEVSQHWNNHLRWARRKFNSMHEEEMPLITPHICRHTFCTNCASSGLNPKTLQMIMGHSSIEITLNVYTHLEAEDVKKSFFTFVDSGRYDGSGYNNKPDGNAGQDTGAGQNPEDAEIESR